MAFKLSDIRASAPGMGRSLGYVAVEGLTVVDANLEKLMGRMSEAGSLRTKVIATKVLEQAKNLVPYRDGDLFRTGKITQARNATSGRFEPREGGVFIVSFGDSSAGVDYAMLIHENPHGWDFNQHPERFPAGYPGPKMAGYLRTPAELAKGSMVGEVKEEVQEAVVGVLQEVRSMRPRLVKRNP